MFGLFKKKRSEQAAPMGSSKDDENVTLAVRGALALLHNHVPEVKDRADNLSAEQEFAVNAFIGGVAVTVAQIHDVDLWRFPLVVETALMLRLDRTDAAAFTRLMPDRREEPLMQLGLNAGSDAVQAAMDRREGMPRQILRELIQQVGQRGADDSQRLTESVASQPKSIDATVSGMNGVVSAVKEARARVQDVLDGVPISVVKAHGDRVNAFLAGMTLEVATKHRLAVWEQKVIMESTLQIRMTSDEAGALTDVLFGPAVDKAIGSAYAAGRAAALLTMDPENTVAPETLLTKLLAKAA